MTKHKSVIFRMALGVFIVYIAVTLIQQQVQIGQHKAQLAQLQTQYKQQQGKNAELQRVLSENDDQYMAGVARDKLGYTKSNERIYINVAGN
ncbi:septum formation initiator family protein [Ethanoligenens sp.]|uniref:septum formation initiator family protein n=1 Tax=Ethanoligenens sp. TaxID=2099655 RepID=UPI0039E9557E